MASNVISNDNVIDKVGEVEALLNTSSNINQIITQVGYHSYGRQRVLPDGIAGKLVSASATAWQMGAPTTLATTQREIQSITINTGATSAGIITLTFDQCLNGIHNMVSFPIAVAIGNSASVATAINSAAANILFGWTPAQATSTIQFTRAGSCSAATLMTFADTGATGVTASIALIAAGTGIDCCFTIVGVSIESAPSTSDWQINLYKNSVSFANLLGQAIVKFSTAGAVIVISTPLIDAQTNILCTAATDSIGTKDITVAMVYREEAGRTWGLA